MAITRAQQARQLYQAGGGADAAKDDFKSPSSSPFSAGYSGAKSAVNTEKVSFNEGNNDGPNLQKVVDAVGTASDLNRAKNVLTGGGLKAMVPEPTTMAAMLIINQIMKNKNNKDNQSLLTEEQDEIPMMANGGIMGRQPYQAGGGADYMEVTNPSPSQGKIEEIKQTNKILNNLADDKAQEKFETLLIKDSNVPGIGGAVLDTFKTLRQKNLDKNVDFFRFDSKTGKAREKYGLDAQGYKDYMSDRLAGKIDAAGNIAPGFMEGPNGTIISTGNDNDPFIPVDTTFNMASSDMDQGTDTDTEDDKFFRRFRAEGGIMNADVVGGEYDFESARQMYGLGKLVKKVTRTVKKIAKSPIGKAALLGVAGFGIPGTSFGGLLGRASFGGAAQGLFGTFGPTSALQKLGIMKSVGDANMAATRTGPLAKLFNSPLSMIGAASTIAGLLTPEEETEAQRIADETGIDIQEIRNNPDKYLARAFKAGGGLMRLGYQEGGDAEPVAKKTMPLLDMDGKEKDYRETGGFVDMGRMEKADDVPARLSKNEFVFTADAVRNAGDGSVDKGAEVMYNMMKNLEAGGEVSEESQGLEGARRMFQTSQRLEEVI